MKLLKRLSILALLLTSGWVWRTELLLLLSSCFSGPRVLRLYHIAAIEPTICSNCCEVPSLNGSKPEPRACIKLQFKLSYKEVPDDRGTPANWTIEPGINGTTDQIQELTITTRANSGMRDLTPLLSNDKSCATWNCTADIQPKSVDAFISAFNQGNDVLHGMKAGISFFVPMKYLSEQNPVTVRLQLKNGTVFEAEVTPAPQ